MKTGALTKITHFPVFLMESVPNSHRFDLSVSEHYYFFLSGCVIDDKMDYRGDDIKNKIVKNQDECAKFCAETKGALFWTYFDKIKRCWVKRANSKKIPDVRLVSGNRQCGLTGN